MGAIISTLFEKPKPKKKNQDEDEEDILEEEEEMDAADMIAAEKKADIAIQKTKRKVRVAASMAKKRKAEAADALAAKKKAEAEAIEAKRKKDAQAALTAKKKAEAAAALAAKYKAEAEAYKRKLAKAREEKRKAEEAEKKRKEEAARKEAARKAREEAERKRKEAARKAREEAERKRKEAARKAREEAARKARKEARARAERERVKQGHRRNAARKATQRVKVCKNGSWNGVNLINAYKKVHTPTLMFSNMNRNRRIHGSFFRTGNQTVGLQGFIRRGRWGAALKCTHVGCYVSENNADKKMLARSFQHGHIKMNVVTPTRTQPARWVRYGKKQSYRPPKTTSEWVETKTHIYFRHGHSWRVQKTYNGHLFVDGNRLMIRKGRDSRRAILLADKEIAKFSGNNGECAVVAVSHRNGTRRVLFVQSNNTKKSYDLVAGRWINHPFKKCPTHAELSKKFCTINGKYKC